MISTVRPRESERSRSTTTIPYGRHPCRPPQWPFSCRRDRWAKWFSRRRNAVALTGAPLWRRVRGRFAHLADYPEHRSVGTKDQERGEPEYEQPPQERHHCGKVLILTRSRVRAWPDGTVVHTTRV